MYAARGFTLIELLVVISIIGVLSSIVLASLSSVRSKGIDSALKQDISDFQRAAENQYDDTGPTGRERYYDVCTPTSASGKIFLDAASKTSAGLNNAICTVENNFNYWYTDAAGTVQMGSHTPGLTTNWAISVRLTDGTYYCADSTGLVATSSALVAGSLGFGHPSHC